MKKYIFWGVLKQHANVAFNENLSRSATGATFWQAMQTLCGAMQEWRPAANVSETDLSTRLKMFHETGVQKVELFIESVGDRYAVRLANMRSLIEAGSEQEALLKFVDIKAQTSVINTGGDPRSPA